MPVTIHIASHPSNPYQPPAPSPTSTGEVLAGLGPAYACGSNGVFQDSIPSSDMDYMTPHRNGFVRTILDAYAGHHHIVLRPDDVWIAILSQFKYFLQAHPEVTRLHFLPDHQPDGPRIDHPLSALGSPGSIDIAVLVNQMTRDVQAKAADPSFRSFVLPSFSTTTVDDKVICAVMMLSSMDSFFDVSMSLMCGIPSVTLLGAQSDWSDILHQRVRPIAAGKYGDEAKSWGKCLCVIVEKFIAAFEQGGGGGGTEFRGGDDRDFWTNIVRYYPGAGEDGAGLIGGWFTAFARWGPQQPRTPSEAASRSLSPADQYESELPTMKGESPERTPKTISSYTVGSLSFPFLHPSRIPSALGHLSFTLSDNGFTSTARLLAGHVGKTWFGTTGDTLQPVSAWIFYIPQKRPGTSTSTKEGGMMQRTAANMMMGRNRKKSAAAVVANEEKRAPSPAGLPIPVFMDEVKAMHANENGNAKNSKIWDRVKLHTRKISEKFGPTANEHS